MTQPHGPDESIADNLMADEEHVRKRGVWWRWAGMTTVTLAVVLVTPIALSFVPGITLSCPSYGSSSRGLEERYLTNGVLCRDEATVSFDHGRPGKAPDIPGPFTFRWQLSREPWGIHVPIWPVPILIGACGAYMWRRGNYTIRMSMRAEDRTLPRDSRWQALRHSTVVSVGLVSGSVLVLSFASGKGVCRYFHEVRESEGFTRSIRTGLENGSVTWESQLFSRGRPSAQDGWPRPGPLRVWWDVGDGYTTICLPVWPIALGLFGIACILTWARERAILRTLCGRCPSCAYPLAEASLTQCPECGHETALPVRESPT